LEAVTQKVAGSFVSTSVQRGDNHATINRKLSTLRAYWKWLVKRGHVAANPWLGQSLPKARDGDDGKKSRGYTPAEWLSLLAGDADATLAAFIRIGALTGMRIETIGQLRVRDCADGVFNIRRDKTAAGVRKVPIHSALRPFIAARCAYRPADAWLFPELTATKRGDRASAISKRFHTYRIGLNIDDKKPGARHAMTVFHSFRNTFVTLAVNAGQPWEIAQQIVDHKPQHGITGSVYFGGYDYEKRRACVEAVRLPEGVPPLVHEVPEHARSLPPTPARQGRPRLP
jgi:integrase